MSKPPRVAGKRWLDEHDRDVFEADLMYDAWLEGNPTVVRVPREEPRDDGYADSDPYDQLKSEGGHLGE